MEGNGGESPLCNHEVRNRIKELLDLLKLLIYLHANRLKRHRSRVKPRATKSHGCNFLDEPGELGSRGERPSPHDGTRNHFGEVTHPATL
jgi:hypothetical protein